MMPAPPAESRDRAAAVFEGEVTSSSVSGDGVLATMRVIRGWKGVSSPAVTISTSTNSAACGIDLAVGTRWLIYAEEHEGQLHAGLCSRSAPSANADADFVALGAPGFSSDGAEDVAEPPATDQPAPVPSSRPVSPAPDGPVPVERNPTGCAGCSAATGSNRGGLALLVALALLRRRRAHALTPKC
jgi:hypothetical protein